MMAEFVDKQQAHTFSKLIRPEWLRADRERHMRAEKQRAGAELLCGDIDVLIDDTDKVTKQAQSDVNQKLEQRVSELEFWERETTEHLMKVKKQIDELLVCEARLTKSLEATLEPAHINDKCLLIRQKRQGVELVHDDAEREMIKEKEVIDGVEKLLKRTYEQVVEQIRLARKLKYNLEKSLKHKEAALDIDRHNIQLKNHSFAIQPNSTYTPTKETSFYHWHSDSQSCIEQATQMLLTCRSLQSIVDDALAQTYEDMQKQKEKVDYALADRIMETKDSKCKMEEQLAYVRKQIADTESYLEKVQKAIERKNEPMKLAQKRLQNRALRPDVEQCGDVVQQRLEEETSVITQSIEKLSLTLATTQNTLKGLKQEELLLLKNIDIKKNTLLIDENECSVLRKTFSIEHY